MFDMFDMFKEEEKKEASPSASPNTFVISIGGSVIIDEKPNTAQIAKFAEVINNLVREGNKFILVVGGGKVARSYAAAAKTLGANNYVQDELGIRITRANAMLLIQALDNAHREVLTEVKKAGEVIDTGKVAVFGGLMPGFTTDAVSALIAESLGATFINLTDVDGVYSTDPKGSRTAKFFPEISYDKLIALMKLSESKPGQNLVLDLPACLILKRSSIRTIVMGGEDLANFEAAVRGGEFNGTVIEEPVVEDRIEEKDE